MSLENKCMVVEVDGNEMKSKGYSDKVRFIVTDCGNVDKILGGSGKNAVVFSLSERSLANLDKVREVIDVAKKPFFHQGGVAIPIHMRFRKD